MIRMSIEYKLQKKFKRVERKSHPLLKELFRIIAIIIGAILVASGLEYFLVPNGFLDGGITGVSIILSKTTPIPLSLAIAIINCPFIILSFITLGKRASIKTAIGIITLVLATIVLHNVTPITHEFTLALGYGGLLVGLGVGLALRYGGALDGVESLAVMLSQRTSLNIEQIILFINLIIFTVAAFTIDSQAALASFLLFYLVVTPIIGKVMDGGNEMKIATIITKNSDRIIDEVHSTINRRVIISPAHRTIINDDIENSVSNVNVLTLIVSRIEESLLSDIVESVDHESIVIFQDASSVNGGVFSRSKHH